MKRANIIAKKIILPCGDIVFGTQVYKRLKFLEKSQWWTSKELEEYQNKKLKALIKHAYNNVTYYHNLFKSLNLNPEDIKTKDDLNKLPVLTKEVIRKNQGNFLAKNIKKTCMIKYATSGSSGKVLEYMLDKNSISMLRAIGIRGWEFAGYNVGDRLVTVAGSSLLSQNTSFLKKLSLRANRNLLFESYNMDNEKVINYLQQIKKFKPKFIRGYPSSISIIADHLLENNGNNIKLTAVMTTGETLHNRDRKKISEAFDCDVFDQCGCNDGGENLWECKEHLGYHIGVERAVHEFINDSFEPITNNERGHIILTDLWNYSMPLIRYDAGDMGVPTNEMCTCGRGLPLAKSIVGRTIEQIILPNRNSIPGLEFTDIFEKKGIADKIIDYQIIQEKIDKFTIKIVKSELYSDEVNPKISKFFEGHMGIPLDINFDFVNNIPTTKANKKRVILSKVKK